VATPAQPARPNWGFVHQASDVSLRGRKDALRTRLVTCSSYGARG